MVTPPIPPSVKQRYSSIFRQAAAWAAIAYSIVTSIQGTAWGAKETVLTLVGGALLTFEHYVGDPSTGTPDPPTGGLT